MSAPSRAPTPRSQPANLADLERARDATIQAWASAAIPRELPRINTKPNGEDNWFRVRGITDGEWMTSMKPQFESAMRPTNTVKERVWGCGMLATSNYKGEIAMMLRNGRMFALTSNNILRTLNEHAERWAATAFDDLTDEEKRKLHVTKQDVRRGIAALESEGRCFRVLKDGTLLRNAPPEQKKGLQVGDVLLFFLFRPLHEEPGAVVIKCLPIFAPPSPFLNVSKTLKLLRLDLDPSAVAANDYLKAELAAAAEDYRKGVSVVMEQAQNRVRVAAESAHIVMNGVSNSCKEEGAAAASSSPAPEPAAAAADPHPEPATDTQPDLTPILEAFAPFDGGITDSRARRLLKDSGGATPEEVGAKAAELAASVRGAARKNVVGILLNQIPEFFHSTAALEMWRRAREESAAQDEAANRRAEERRSEVERELAESEPFDEAAMRAEAIERMKRKG